MDMPFFDPENSLGFLTITTNRLMSAHVRKRLVEAGIDVTPEQWAVLVHLWHKGAMAQDELANIACVEKSSLSRVLDVMERRGLVRRVRDPGDARRRVLFSTEQAAALRDPCLKVARAALAEMLVGINRDELAICLNILTQVKQNIRTLTE